MFAVQMELAQQLLHVLQQPASLQNHSWQEVQPRQTAVHDLLPYVFAELWRETVVREQITKGPDLLSEGQSSNFNFFHRRK